MPLDQTPSDEPSPSEGLLLQTLEMIALEHGGRFEQSAPLARRLAATYNDQSALPWRIYTDLPSECAPDFVSDLFSLLIYNTRDNGRTICAWAEQVLEHSNDFRQIQIALQACNWGVYPFRHQVDMRSKLAGITARFPELADKCGDFAVGWSRSMRNVRYPRIREVKRGFEGAGDA
jgi:hypothetical protein